VHDEVVLYNKVPAELVEGVFSSVAFLLLETGHLGGCLAVTVRAAAA
jgi:hypothetical protein